jgi:hypothetical protein
MNHRRVDREISMKKRKLILYVITIKILITTGIEGVTTGIQGVIQESIEREKDQVHQKITIINVFQARQIMAKEGQRPVAVMVIQGIGE